MKKRSIEEEQALVRMGKGQYKTMKHVVTASWRGTENIGAPWDREQSEINKKAGYWS